MIFNTECPSCLTSFPIDSGKVPDGGVYARCSECPNVFLVVTPEPDAVPSVGGVEPVEPAGAVGSEARVEVSAGVVAGSEADPGADVEEDAAWGAVSDAADEVVDDAGAGWDDLSEVVEEPTSESTIEAAAQVADIDLVEVVTQIEVTESVEVTTEWTPGAPDDAGTSEAESGTETAFGVDPALEVESGSEMEPGSEIEPVPEIEPALEVESVAEVVDAPAPEAPSRPVFGKRDPNERAARLARVLVSDMIAYHPDRHRRSLEAGTLADDFDEEIQKSWAEYVDQVGRDLAESTPYFTDALNQVLARGQQVF